MRGSGPCACSSRGATAPGVDRPARAVAAMYEPGRTRRSRAEATRIAAGPARRADRSAPGATAVAEAPRRAPAAGRRRDAEGDAELRGRRVPRRLHARLPPATLPPMTDYSKNGPFTTMEIDNTGPSGSYTIVQPMPLGRTVWHPPAMWGNGDHHDAGGLSDAALGVCLQRLRGDREQQHVGDDAEHDRRTD